MKLPKKTPGRLPPIPPGAALFQLVGMNLLGPLPASASGNCWVILATDYLTRYADTKASSPFGTASVVAKFIVESIVLGRALPRS